MVQFRNKPVTIDAVNNDGTDASAEALAKWVLDGGGVADLYPIGSVEQAPTKPFVVIYEGEYHTILGPGHWAYRYSSHGAIFVSTTEQFNAMWELHFSLADVYEQETVDKPDLRKRRDRQADPIERVGRRRRTGSPGVDQGGEQSGDGLPTPHQLPDELAPRVAV